jgi:hypothetical protein
LQKKKRYSTGGMLLFKRDQERAPLGSDPGGAYS